MRKIGVVGAGIVGLSVAYHLRKVGAAVTIIDRDPAGDKASFGNAGGIAVTEVIPASTPSVLWNAPRWLLDPLGPLSVRPTHMVRLIPWLYRFSKAALPENRERISRALSSLNSRTYDDLLPMLEAVGLSGEIHSRGALTVYESDQARSSDANEWEDKRRHGIEVQYLTGRDARDLEPALGPVVSCAVMTPQWSHISNPKALVDRLRDWLLGSLISLEIGEASSVSSNDTSALVTLRDGKSLKFDEVVVAAGAWSSQLAQTVGDRVLLESERGYNATIANPGIALSREIIFAERKFVATPLSIGLRIGGAAEFGGLDASPNYRRSETLVKLAQRYLPRLQTDEGKPWAGHRPTTPDSLPVIGRSPKQSRVVYAFGHGHLGLTQAATTGRIVADVVCGKEPDINLAPFAVSRFS